MEYEKTFEAVCPKDGTKTSHTVTYRKGTCSRFRESISWFFCEKNSQCRECQEDYE